MRRVVPALTVLLLTAASAPAAFLSFPSNLIEQEQVSGTATVIRDVPRQYAGYVDAQAYTGQTSAPVLIVGMQFRLAIGNNWRVGGNTADAWPSVDLVMPRYTVTLGRPSPTVASAREFSSLLPWVDLFSNPVTVRSGPLTLPANSYQATGGANGVHAWGPTIPFSTPFAYQPGASLVYYVSHDGISNFTGNGANLASRYNAPGWTDAVWANNATSPAPLAYNQVQYVRFVTAPIPEPATAAVLFAPAIAMLARRRRP